MNDKVDDILNQDHIFGDLNELGQVVKDNFDNLEVVILLWHDGGNLHHRAYGTTSEIIGILEKAKYIILRSDIGGTIDPG